MARPPLPQQGESPPWGDDLNAHVAALGAEVDALASGGGTSASQYVPVLIFNGESNSGGQALNSQALPSELAPRPAVQIFDNVGLASFLTLDIGTNNNLDHFGLPPTTLHGWELGLANSVEAGQWWDDTVYIIKTGQGGSTISQWGVGGTYYTKLLQRVRTGLSLLRSQGKVPLVYFWYTMGINDAIAGTVEATWKTATEEFFSRIRKEFGYIPIIFSHVMDGSPGAAFNDSIDAMAVTDNMITVVDATGTTLQDQNHWDYAGMKVMSGRMSTATKNFGQWDGYNSRRIDMMWGSTAPPAPPASVPTIVRNPATVSFTEGASGTLSVSLSSAPAADVVVTVAISGGNATRSPATLTFTSGNFATTQTVTVNSANDGAASGNRSATVTLSASGLATVTAAVTIVDAGAAAAPPGISVLPAITGTAEVGNLLTCSTGTWTGTPTSYAYQWKNTGSNIVGATASTYMTGVGDTDKTITCTVAATNANGTTSATTAGTLVSAPSVALNLVTWGNFSGTDSPSAGKVRCLTTTASEGALATGTIDLTAAFDVEVEMSANAITSGVVVVIDNDNVATFQWTSSAFVIGTYHVNNALQSTVSALISTPIPGQTLSGYPVKIKMSKSGNDVVFRRANSGGGYGGVIYTEAGVLTGQTIGYIKCMFATPAVNQEVTVRRS